jgi:3-hydroxyisobutyrate dehydrogenase-like beta-hydroxyacid dehydrogenase
MQVGFIGLGAMGNAMANNLLKAGFALSVNNRSRAKAEALVAKGAALAKTPGEAAQGDVVITMLADDAAVESAVLTHDGMLKVLSPSAIHISMSTISVALAERLTTAHLAKKQGFIAAPVFGRPEAAAGAELYVVVAGALEAVQRCQPLFDVLGRRSFVVGNEPPKANLVKLSGNFLITSVIEALGEAFALVRKAGIDRAQFLDVLTNTLFGAPIYKTYGGLISEEQYQPAGFKAELGYKDIRLAIAAAQALKVPMPLASLIATRLLTLIAQGEGHLDWAALAKLAAREAGLGLAALEPIAAGQ